MPQSVILTLQASIVCIVFAVGLRASLADLLFLWRRPALLLRSVLAMLVIMPVVAIALTTWFDAPRAAEIVLIATAIAPVPPLLPRRQAKAGGHQHYAVSLMATLALLSIVTIPVSVELLELYSGQPLTMPMAKVTQVAAVSVLLPLMAGLALRAWTPAAERVDRAASLLGFTLLAVGVVLLLAAGWRGIWAEATGGTLLLVTLFVAIGVIVGRALGGPDPRNATVLGLSSACRHPAMTLSIASASFPDQRFGGIVLLYLLAGLVLLTPYVAWSRQRAADEPQMRGGPR
jgi:BASS family bile acid:Na+ symporter